MSTAVTRPSLRKPILTRASNDGRARPMKCSSSRLMRIITGAPVFFASSAGTATVCVPGILLPKPPPVYSLMTTTCVGVDADPLRHRRHGLHHALRRAVQIQLAVLPVRHRGARFERLMAGRLRVEGLVEDEIAPAESRRRDRRTPIACPASPIGIVPSGALAKSVAVHLCVFSLPPTNALPSRRAFGPPDAGSRADRRRTAAAPDRA